MNKPKKKKGRPPKNLPSTPPNPFNCNSTATTNHRFTRRNPNKFYSHPPQPDFDEDDERKEKKVKLVVRLPESEKQANINQLQQNRRHSRDYDSGSGTGSDPESEDRGSYSKKRKINPADHRSDDDVSNQEKDEVEATDSPVHGSPFQPGPTTPLPDKKLLIFILDRLQKKDTRGVFSEAVDSDELPDYFEIIEQPMDFGTVRKKLDSGAYRNLEEFEADIFLICSNAMEYNATDTMYYRQARSIQELAKRDFQNLRNEGEDGEPQPKVVRRGRPPGTKILKKSLETSPVNSVTPSVVPELSSGATLASEEEKAMRSNSYNLRKTPMPNRFRSTDPFFSSYLSRNGESHSDWNNEFPAKILRADMKYGSKHFMMDENRRHTYKQFPDSYSGGNYPVVSDFVGAKRLVMVGLQEPLAYARSLARYAASIGPVAWKIASNKIQSTIPAGIQYGPGLVDDNGPPSQPSSVPNEKHKSSSNITTVVCNSAQLLTPSVSDPCSAVGFGPSEGMVEAVRKLNSQNDQKHVFQSQISSFGGLVGNSSTLMQQQRCSLSDPPDLNVRVLPSSSSLQIGSPQQPELALQL